MAKKATSPTVEDGLRELEDAGGELSVSQSLFGRFSHLATKAIRTGQVEITMDGTFKIKESK